MVQIAHLPNAGVVLLCEVNFNIVESFFLPYIFFEALEGQSHVAVKFGFGNEIAASLKVTPQRPPAFNNLVVSFIPGHKLINDPTAAASFLLLRGIIA